MTKKGFTLIELLLAILVMVSLFTISLHRFSEPKMEWILFSNEYLSKQADSIVNKKENIVASPYSNNYIHFNKEGRVNQAQTIMLDGKNVIIHLGNGYLTYE